MSIGIGASAKLVLEDERTVIYQYGGYNQNDSKKQMYDGIITISKECFAEPEIHKKIKKMPSGRKKVIIKRIPVSVDCEKMLKEGLIQIENCSNCWQVTDDKLHVDVMACRILFRVFLKYQEDGRMPIHIGYDM